MSPYLQLDACVGEVPRRVGGLVLRQLDRVHLGPGELVGYRSAMAPEPVQSSTTTGALSVRHVIIGRSRSIAQPAITSVSGRGTNTPGPTSSSRSEVRPSGQVLQRDPRRLVDQRRKRAA